MSEVVKNRYSDKDLEEFKVLIDEKIEKQNRFRIAEKFLHEQWEQRNRRHLSYL